MPHQFGFCALSAKTRGERIAAIGPTAEVRARHPAPKVIDARRKVVLPGLVDLHGHLSGGLMKTIGERLDASRSRSMIEFVASHVAAPEWWQVEALINALERLKFGTTTSYTMLSGNGTRTDGPVFTRRRRGA